jgi:hypothetical protein
VLWYERMRKIAFSVSCRAALGDLLRAEDIYTLYPMAVAHKNAVFAMVQSPDPLLMTAQLPKLVHQQSSCHCDVQEHSSRTGVMHCPNQSHPVRAIMPRVHKSPT